LTPAPALARHFGIEKLLLKDEGRNAPGSMKDRAGAVGMVKAQEARRRIIAWIIACASTGNAASSCAAEKRHFCAGVRRRNRRSPRRARRFS
jgi:threonine synthase